MKKETLLDIDLAIEVYRNSLIDDINDNSIRVWVEGDLLAHKALNIPVARDLVHLEAVRFGKVNGKLLREEGASIIRGQKIAWLSDSTEATRSKVVDIINQGIAEGLPMGDITGKKIVPDTVSYNLRETLVRDKDYEYVRIARDQTTRIQNQGALNRFDKNNITHVRVHDGHDFDDECRAADGQIWTIEYAQTNESAHPNCTRSFSPIIPRGWEPT